MTCVVSQRLTCVENGVSVKLYCTPHRRRHGLGIRISVVLRGRQFSLSMDPVSEPFGMLRDRL